MLEMLERTEALTMLFRWMARADLRPAEFARAINDLRLTTSDDKSFIVGKFITVLDTLAAHYPECFLEGGLLKPNFIETLALTTGGAAVGWHREGDALLSPTGSKIAEIRGGMLWLYDKKLKTSLPFSIIDWTAFVSVSEDSNAQN